MENSWQDFEKFNRDILQIIFDYAYKIKDAFPMLYPLLLEQVNF